MPDISAILRMVFSVRHFINHYQTCLLQRATLGHAAKDLSNCGHWFSFSFPNMNVVVRANLLGDLGRGFQPVARSSVLIPSDAFLAFLLQFW
jgi:hypothetical protein